MQMGMSNTPPSGDSLRGLILASATYVLWGFLPLFMKELAHVPPSEVIAHRVLWSLPIALAVLMLQRRCSGIRFLGQGGVLLGHLVQMVHARVDLGQCGGLVAGGQGDGCNLIRHLAGLGQDLLEAAPGAADQRGS